MADYGQQEPASGYVGYLVVRVAEQMSRQFTAALTPAGLTPRQFSVLAVLAATPDLTSAQIARAVLTTPQGMHVVVQQLEDRGFLHRPAHRGRGRVAPIQLTNAGRHLLENVTPLIDALEERTRDRLGELGYTTLMSLLTQLDEATSTDAQ